MSDLDRVSLELFADESLSGFRLHRLEVLNWGTFDERVWTLTLDGHNTLLTGDIGSGKSTLVDAMTTLLVPAHRVAYNRAAGAEAKERTLRSYVLGHYKSERSEIGASAKPVALRDINKYSVILAVFRDSEHQQAVTIAQVFWITDRQPQPVRLFVGAEGELSIATHFAHFGTDMSQLRKALRATGTEIFDTFPPYGAWFRRRLGIENEQALELFHQAVSMKSVDNLTDFVRAHMLEPFDVGERIRALIEHFDDLHRAHEAVLKAKKQIELLLPLVDDYGRHSMIEAEIRALRSCRDALGPYISNLRCELLTKRITILSEELERQNNQVSRLDERCSSLRNEESEIKRNIADNGGDRLDKLTAEITRQVADQRKRKERSDRYGERIRLIGETPASDEAGFLQMQKRFSTLADAARAREAGLENDATEREVILRQSRQEHQELSAEIASLEARNSNIRASQVIMRTELCTALGILDLEMPFVGELLQVRDTDRDWEGAAERALRSFGLSLLVPDGHYARVADWVEKTHLRGRLVYYRVRQHVQQELVNTPVTSLAHKLEIKPDSPFYIWLDRELSQRFDYACATTQEQFRRETRAITRAGQIKGRGERHEKDDRYRIDDRSQYILGWTNAAKIAALNTKRTRLESLIGGYGTELSRLQAELRQVRDRLTNLSALDEYPDFRDIDWQSIAIEVARLSDEKRTLETASDKLRLLSEKLVEITSRLGIALSEWEQHKDKRSRTAQKKEDAERLRAQTQMLLEDPHYDSFTPFFERLSRLRTEIMPDHQSSLESCDNDERTLRERLQTMIDAEDHKLKRLRDKIIQAMTSYKEEFKLEASEVDASMEAGFEFQRMLQSLQADDLPKFEAKFKELLNENTIREVANFQSQLNRERETIKERISHINLSLAQIDYNPSRYIVLEAQLTSDSDIRDFQTELRACTEGALTGSDDIQYSEEKFLLVSRIVERFRGRQGLTDADRHWTNRVTDVRNWFVFAASERWREDDTEHEHYSDSGGKSGGQKEKLAYTILAASLTYQFGLERGVSRPRSFRFVMLDEAFGRGSEVSAQYALRLFAELDLQLLVATPLQKIHVIEPFVRSVGFVNNEDGHSSKLRNLSIEEYRAEKARRSSESVIVVTAEEQIEATVGIEL